MLCAVLPSHLDISRSLQITGDLDIKGAVVLWDLFVQINVCVLDHLKRAMVREKGTCMCKNMLDYQLSVQRNRTTMFCKRHFTGLSIAHWRSHHLRSGS